MTSKQRFDAFIEANLDKAHQLAKVYVKNQDDVEDVVAESIVKALRNIDGIKDPDYSIKRWFEKILINTAIDHLRTQAKINKMKAQYPRYTMDEFMRLELDFLLDILPDDDRQIVSMRFYDNCSLQEIADTLSMNQNTVKTRLYRALRKLKLEITDEGTGVVVSKGRSPIRSFSIFVAAILLSATAVFNLSPTLAAAAYDIPVLGDVVRVITFNRFEYRVGGYSAEILVPEIQGLLDPELQDRLNAEFRDNADTLIRAFEEEVISIKEEFGEDIVRMSLKSDYIVKTDNSLMLSLDTYIYSDTNSFVLHKFYNIDKRNSVLINLENLFSPSANYVTPISEYIVTEMIRLNEEESKVYFVPGSEFQGNHFTAIRPDQNFYINEQGKLVICFDKHEVGAGFMGSPEFVIPSEVIQDITHSDLLD